MVRASTLLLATSVFLLMGCVTTQSHTSKMDALRTSLTTNLTAKHDQQVLRLRAQVRATENSLTQCEAGAAVSLKTLKDGQPWVP